MSFHFTQRGDAISELNNHLKAVSAIINYRLKAYQDFFLFAMISEAGRARILQY